MIDLEKSFPTNPNMTYFACIKAEIIASEVDFAKKSKKLIFLDFRSIERVNEPKTTLKARFCLQVVFTVQDMRRDSPLPFRVLIFVATDFRETASLAK